ncbi:hypothetical protein DV738_g4022, partial [Chaetothyriales sp. CBS 135597]
MLPQSDFLQLPPELCVLVMTYLETPRDLFAFVSTAKPIQQIFQANRAAVLEGVLRNAIPGENFCIAVAACAASQTSKLWWARSSATIVEESWDRFRKNFPRGYALDSSMCDWNLLVSLSKLWWISDYFITRFEQDALTFAASNISQQSTRSRTRSSEIQRLQRAFLRFEIYRRITPESMGRSRDMPDSMETRILDFFHWFPPWEREEVLSVQEFLVMFVKNMCRRLGDYMVLEISNIAKDMAAKSEASNGAFERESIEDIEAELDLGSLDVFQLNSITRRRFQYAVARGLPFIRWLADLNSCDQIDAVVRHSTGYCSASFFERLWYMRSQLNAFDTQVGWLESASTGALKDPNQGWIWAKQHGLTTDVNSSLLIRYNLRRMGYVFWGAARLHDDWRLQKILPSMLELPQRSRDDNDRDWLEEPGMEERFQDIPIPKGAFRDIEARLKPSDEMQKKIENGYPTPFSDKEAELFGIEY